MRSLYDDPGGRGAARPGSDLRFKAGGLRNSAVLALADVVVRANTGGLGGGIFNSGVLAGTNVSVSSDTADFGADGNAGTTFGSFPNRGGGITHRRGTMTIANSTVSGNRASAHGGGISVETGVVNLNNVTITNNTTHRSRLAEWANWQKDTSICTGSQVNRITWTMPRGSRVAGRESHYWV